MSKLSKLPVMVLQELTVKHGFPSPAYDLINSTTGTHRNVFNYQLSVAGINAFGTGPSKQIGKHNAAYNALQLLAELGVYDPQEDPVEQFNATMIIDPNDSPFKESLNFISTLKDVCFENKITDPAFIELSAVGPPHCRVFTYECQVASIKTQATGNTKKKAKHLAAKDMLEKIKNILPSIREACENERKAITDTDERVAQKINEIDFFNTIIPNKSVFIDEYSLTLKKLMKEKDIEFASLEQFLEQRDEEALNQLLGLFELSIHSHHLQECPTIVILTLNTDTPFSTVGMADDFVKAKAMAIEDIFKILDLYLRL